MMKTGKCPKCEKVPAKIALEGIEIGAPFAGTTYVGVSYLCPYCRTILGVGIDPVALKTDTIDGVVKKLRGSV